MHILLLRVLVTACSCLPCVLSFRRFGIGSSGGARLLARSRTQLLSIHHPSTSTPNNNNNENHPESWATAQSGLEVLGTIRGGAEATTVTTAKKKKRKRKSSSSSDGTTKTGKRKRESGKKKKKNDTTTVKQKISETLETTDSVADALGDAIRRNPDAWMPPQQTNNNDSVLFPNDTNNIEKESVAQAVDASLRSVRWSLGASDNDRKNFPNESLHGNKNDADDESTGTNDDNNDDEGGGGIEAAPASMIMYYFLKSHGGAHGLQSICSLLSCATGGTALGLLLLFGKHHHHESKFSHFLTAHSLVRRSLLYAMLKHLAGLVAASGLAARAIPELGLTQTRIGMRKMIQSYPVSQYVFYTACLWMWTGSTPTFEAAKWWQQVIHPVVVPALILCPVLLREVVSTSLVVQDVLVLLTASSSSITASVDDGHAVVTPWFVPVAKTLLSAQKAGVNAAMSLVVTPGVWRQANRAQQQTILARLTAQISLGTEVAVGIVLLVDALWGLVRTTFGMGSSSTSDAAAAGQLTWKSWLRSAFCARLYTAFLWNRRSKVRKLAYNIRGGAAHVPLYLLQVLHDPLASMGLDDDNGGSNSRKNNRVRNASSSSSSSSQNNKKEIDRTTSSTWKQYMRAAMDWETDR